MEEKTIRKANQKAEVNWPVPDAWKTGVNIASWASSFSNSYEGPSGGPDIYGPSYTRQCISSNICQRNL